MKRPRRAVLPQSTTRSAKKAERSVRKNRVIRTVLAFFFVIASALLAVAYPAGSLGAEWLDVSWQRPLWFLGFLVIPFVIWRTTYGVDRRSARVRLGTVAPLRGGPRGLRSHLRDLPGVLRTVGLSLCILALARPVSTVRPATAEEEGIDLVVVLDLSGSMQAVMDQLPKDLEKYTQRSAADVLPMRLEAAKAVLRDFISRRRTDRIGVVVFGKSAYVLSPPTLDYQLLDQLVSRMQLNNIDPNGTAIGDALGVAVARLRRSHAKSKAVVLLTDGDNKGGKLSPQYAAHLANVIGAKVFTIQIGEGEEARIHRGFDLFGRPRYESVAFPTNPELLQELAQTTGGSSYIASDAAKLQASLHDVLDRLEKTRFEAAQATYEDLYRYLLLPAVVLLAIEALLSAFVLRRFP